MADKKPDVWEPEYGKLNFHPSDKPADHFAVLNTTVQGVEIEFGSGIAEEIRKAAEDSSPDDPHHEGLQRLVQRMNDAMKRATN